MRRHPLEHCCFQGVLFFASHNKSLYDYIESKKVLAYDYISNYYYNGKEFFTGETMEKAKAKDSTEDGE